MPLAALTLSLVVVALAAIVVVALVWATGVARALADEQPEAEPERPRTGPEA